MSGVTYRSRRSPLSGARAVRFLVVCLVPTLVVACLAGPAGVAEAPSPVPAPTAAELSGSPAPRDAIAPSPLPTPAPTPPPSPSPTDPPPTPEPTLEREPGTAATGPTETATVVRVVDGDTIVVRVGGSDQRLRYIGVDTPETVHPSQLVEWMGREASVANKALVEGRQVVLEKDVSETDRFGRLLRYVWVRSAGRWTLVNLELVRRGFAQVVTYPPDVKYVDLYLAAQAEARSARRGLWAPPPGPTSASRPTPRPTSASRPTPRPTSAAHRDRDCPDFSSQAAAQRYFEATGGSPSNNFDNLDADHDGVACEGLRSGRGGGTSPTSRPRRSGCDPSYPGVCISPRPPDLDCPQISYRRFAVIGSDPHRFDADNDGIGCER